MQSKRPQFTRRTKVELNAEAERLRRELAEALEQQTATSEILSVMSNSPTSAQPVFDTIARNAVRLCGAVYSTLYRVEGRLIHFVAHHNFTPEQLETWRRAFPRPADGTGAPVQRVVRTGTVYRIGNADIQPDVDADPATREGWRARGLQSLLIVPMFRRSEVIGAIGVTHVARDAFTDSHVRLLQTFADQAVIAIENVRLFTELQARTGELQRSVGQLTALGEVGQAVSSSLDLETVLATIVSRAVQISRLDGGTIFEYDEAAEQFIQRAATGAGLPAGRAVVRKGEGVVGRTALTLEPVQLPDMATAGAYEGRLRETIAGSGVRALLAVPIIREGRLLGGLGVSRKQPGEFPADTVDLLRTFATQSALAIQNARLFREIEATSRQLATASQHKSEFLANMSHELRTPLNAIIGYSEMLQEEARDRRQVEFIPDLEKINAAAKHQLSLINDILDLSKIEAGRMELELADFHLPTAIDNALTLVRERAARRRLTLQANIDPRLGDVRADERKVKQVVLNLLSNAIKFTSEGGGVAVRAAPVDGSVEVAVSDTGVGITPEDQAAVFEEFRQVGMSAARHEGTGLGLALCRKFVELHGGRIWVTSQVGVGSTFTFTIPGGPK